MRQALGKLGTARPGEPKASRRPTHQATPGVHRQRFRQDGEVPVVRLALPGTGRGGGGGKRQKPVPAEGISTEAAHHGETWNRAGGDTAREMQALAEQLCAMQTRLGHAELALAEANRSSQAGQEEAAGLREALAGSQAILAQLRGELAAGKLACATTGQQRQKTKRREMDHVDPGAALVRRKVGRPLGSTNRVRNQDQADGPEAVKWWTAD